MKTNMSPIRGWGPKDKRLRAFAPHGHWRTLTFLAALRNDRLTAPCVFDGPMNGQCFRAYFKQQLVPVLKPGGIVVMDNLGSHKSIAIRQLINAAGARFWLLPLVGPQSDRTSLLQARALDENAQKRTIDDTWRHIGRRLKPLKASHPMSLFSRHGLHSPNASPLIRSIKCQN